MVSPVLVGGCVARTSMASPVLVSVWVWLGLVWPDLYW